MIFISILLLLAGFFFLTTAAVGSLRFPDFYTRSHVLGVTDTLGTLLILAGVVVYKGFSLDSAKLIMLLVFIYIANPTVTHVLVRAAKRSGLKPWTKEDAASR